MGFLNVSGISAAEKQEQNIRTFIGDGSPVLRVPGLKSYSRVRVGSTEIPLSITHEVPTDATLKRLETVEVPLIQMATMEDGSTVLLRNTMSNDGIWQKGEPVYVGGEFEDEVPAADNTGLGGPIPGDASKDQGK